MGPGLIAAAAWASELVAGADLVAWRALRGADGDEAVAAYRDFVEQHPGSPLAEVALGRLDELGALDGWRPEGEAAREALPGLTRSLAAHRFELARRPSAVAVALLDPDGAGAEVPDRPWHASAVAGAWLAGGPEVGIGVQGGWGPVGVGVRAAGGYAWLVEVDARVAPTIVAPAFAEVGVDTLARVNGRLGVAPRLAKRVSAELSAGVLAGERIAPAVRLEIAWPLL